MLIVLIAKKDLDSDSGFGLTILEYSRIVNYSELPIPSYEVLFYNSVLTISARLVTFVKQH